MDIDSNIIKSIIESRYSKGHAVFKEFRTMTGYNPAHYIDVVTVGLWAGNAKVTAFEVKISRADFLVDVARFKDKHKHALAVSEEFYYICPWKLIDKSEVPEVAGLYWINKSNKMMKRKQAQFREKPSIPFYLFAAFAREFGAKIDHTKIPVQYLGKEISQDDFMDIVKDSQECGFDIEVEKKANEIQEELVKERARIRALMSQIRNISQVWRHRTGDDEEIINGMRERIASADKLEVTKEKLLSARNNLDAILKEF